MTDSRTDRHSPKEVAHAILTGGRIQLATLIEVLALLEEKTDYVAHVELVVWTTSLRKTVDNEADLQETARRLREAPPKKPVRSGPGRRRRAAARSSGSVGP